MILFWNRKEVYMGNSLERFYEARQRLEDNGIKYDYKLVSNNSASLFGSSRSQFGSFGENLQLSTMYYLYVHKKDYDYACGVSRSR